MNNLKIKYEIFNEKFPLNDFDRGNKEIYDDWPVTYILHNNKNIYVGETVHLLNRIKNHEKNKKDDNYEFVKIIYSEYFNKSAIYELETELIRLFSADQKYNIKNTKLNQEPHNYYQKKYYGKKMLKGIWEDLQKNLGLTTYDILINKEIFKYSPYTAFSEEQINVIKNIIIKLALATNETNKLDVENYGEDFSEYTKTEKNFFIISGAPGTGKTLLAIKLIEQLKKLELNYKKIAVISRGSSLITINKILKDLKIKGINFPSMSSLCENEKEYYDLILVDEGQLLLKSDPRNQNVNVLMLI